MDNDVNAAEPLQNGICNGRAGFGSGDIPGYEQIGNIAGPPTGSCEHCAAALPQPRRHSLADPFRAARYENALALKLVVMRSHQWISNDAILPDSTLKTN